MICIPGGQITFPPWISALVSIGNLINYSSATISIVRSDDNVPGYVNTVIHLAFINTDKFSFIVWEL